MQIAVADRDKVDIETFAKVCKASGKESIHVATVQASKAVSDIRMRALATSVWEKFPEVKAIDALQFGFDSAYCTQLQEMQQELAALENLITSEMQSSDAQTCKGIVAFQKAATEHWQPLRPSFRIHNLAQQQSFTQLWATLSHQISRSGQ